MISIVTNVMNNIGIIGDGMEIKKEEMMGNSGKNNKAKSIIGLGLGINSGVSIRDNTSNL